MRETEIHNLTHDVETAMESVKLGVGHSSEQVFAWLESWSDGKKLPIPKPDILPNELTLRHQLNDK